MSHQGFRWHVCDSLTGNIVGRLDVATYEITEEIRAAGVGTLTVPMPKQPEAVRRLNRLLRPGDRRAHGRAIAWEDIGSGKILFYGPIMKTPDRAGPVLTVPVADWSAWFRSALVRPTGAKFVTKRDYIVTGREQCLIMTDLMSIALEGTIGDPAIVVDTAPTSGVNRDRTARMFTKVGDVLDELANTAGGVEWFTYGTRNPRATQIIGHVAAAWPERGSGQRPIRLSWKQDLAGNISGNIDSYTWPGGEDVPTRVFGTDAQEEVTLWGYAEDTSTIGLTDIVWEGVVDLADGTTDKATATARAKGELQRASAFDGLLELTVNAERLDFHKLVVGDRARIEIDDGWNRTINVPAARIVRRVLSGGAGKPTVQTLTADLDDTVSPFATGLPGVAVNA